MVFLHPAKKPSVPVPGTKGCFLPRYHPYSHIVRTFTPVTGRLPSLSPGQLPGEPRDTAQAGSQPVTHPLLEPQAPYFPVQRVSLRLLYTIFRPELQEATGISRPGKTGIIKNPPEFPPGDVDCQKTSPQESLAEFLRPQPQESNEDPSFPGTATFPAQHSCAAYAKNVPPAHFLYAAASEMTLLAQDGLTFPSGIEAHLVRIPLKKVAEATFLTH